MSMPFRIENKELRFAYDVWHWFLNTPTFHRRDARAVDSLYTQLRRATFDRGASFEELVSLHSTIHLELLNAGENPNDGMRRTLFLNSFEKDDLLKDEVKILLRKDDLTYEEAVSYMRSCIRNLVLKGEMPKPAARVHTVAPNSEGQSCSICSTAGRDRLAPTHIDAECRFNEESPSYLFCKFCSTAGHPTNKCFKKRKASNQGARPAKLHKTGDTGDLDRNPSTA